jgi:hypothetical protein
MALIIIANEVIHEARKKEDHNFILKVNFHKAFNSVLWEYLDEVMEYMVFGNK